MVLELVSYILAIGVILFILGCVVSQIGFWGMLGIFVVALLLMRLYDHQMKKPSY